MVLDEPFGDDLGLVRDGAQPVLLPVGRDVRRGGEEAAPRQVVVDDRLDYRLVGLKLEKVSWSAS